MNVFIYCRTSTIEQHLSNQRNELIKFCDNKRYNVLDIYEEQVSSTKEDRTELNRMMNDCLTTDVDKIVIYSLCRISRSMSHLVKILQQLSDMNIHLFSYVQNLDTSVEFNKYFFYFVSIFNEFENEMRRERQKIGIKNSKLRGNVQFGRKRTITDETIQRVKDLREKNYTIRDISKECSISKHSVSRFLNN